MKTCSKCGIKYPATADYFHRKSSNPDGLNYWCKLCMSEYTKARYQADPESKKEQSRRWRLANLEKHQWHQRNWTLKQYGLTQEMFADLLEQQGGVCAGCLRTSTKVLCVDHDHDTGKVRGLLCDNCNVALGRLNDDPKTLRRLADYLETNSSDS